MHVRKTTVQFVLELRWFGRSFIYRPQYWAQLWYWFRRILEAYALCGMGEFLRMYLVSLKASTALLPVAWPLVLFFTLLFLVNTCVFPLGRPPE